VNERSLILASASPRRVELLRSLNVAFEVRASHAEELHDPKLSAAEICATNAVRKAASVACDHPHRIVLGADTLVTLNGELFGKPRDLDAAFEMLSKLSGQTHLVITGVSILQPASDRQEMFLEETRVTFKRLTPETIRAYLDAVPVLDKAGAYGIQERGEMLVENIAGSLSNVIGFPLEKLADALVRWNVLSSRERDRIAEFRNYPDRRT